MRLQRSNRQVTGGEDRNNKDYIFEYGGNNGAGAENNTLDFSDRAVGEVTGIRDRDVKSDAFEDGDNDRVGTETIH